MGTTDLIPRRENRADAQASPAATVTAPRLTIAREGDVDSRNGRHAELAQPVRLRLVQPGERGECLPCQIHESLEVGKFPEAPELKGMARIEAFLERLANRNRFFQRLFSRIWLPLAFHSGLTMKKLDANTFTYVLPFRRFNKNFYNAMAGAALLANSEIAAGMYLFQELGGQWTVVCKQMQYKFLLPCFGPAIYQVRPLQELKEKLAQGKEFNIDMALDILQQVKHRGKQPRVGRCYITFHCAPKRGDGNRGLLNRRTRRRRSR